MLANHHHYYLVYINTLANLHIMEIITITQDLQFFKTMQMSSGCIDMVNFMQVSYLKCINKMYNPY